MAVAGLILSVIFLAVPRLKESQRRNQANTELNTIVTASGIAQQYKGKTLRLITGNGCSQCACRLPAGVDSAACISNWQTARNRISAAGYDISDLETDPWGSPYGLDENEGEFGPSDCRTDAIYSAGADGIFSTADDISRRIPLKNPACS